MPLFLNGFAIIRDTSIYWSPIVLAIILWELYVYYLNAKWIRDQKYSLLEIKIPKEILKSPKAMEMVLEALHQPSEGSLIDRYIKGRVRSWFSLEIVSNAGDIKFFIRGENKYRNLIEAHIYSQYPNVEVYDATEDYTQNMPYDVPGSDWAMYGADFKLTKEDAYPIKTYVDYGLSEDPKEEFKVDPITPVIEFLGSVGQGEQVWIQILCMATKDRFSAPGKWFKKEGWKEQAAALIKKLMKRDEATTDLSKAFTSTILSPGERTTVESIERSLGKYGFDCGYRTIYFGKGDKFNGTNITRLLSSTKQYGSTSHNGFKPNITTSFDYPWQDIMGIRLKRRKWTMFDAYRRRAYYYPPYVKTPFVLNTEELATIFHFPGAVAITPTLKRIESHKAEPPSNLPI